MPCKIGALYIATSYYNILIGEKEAVITTIYIYIYIAIDSTVCKLLHSEFSYNIIRSHVYNYIL